MIRLDEHQIAEIQKYTGLTTDDSNAQLAALQAKAAQGLKAGDTTVARELLSLYNTNFAMNFAYDLKQAFNEQANIIKYDTTLSDSAKEARVEKLRTAYAEEAITVAAKFKDMRNKLVLDIREAARNKVAEPHAPVDALKQGEFDADLKFFRSKMLVTLDARKNVESMNDLIAKYRNEPALIAQLSDSFDEYVQVTQTKNHAKDVALPLSKQLDSLTSYSQSADQIREKHAIDLVDGLENKPVFHETKLDTIGNTIGSRYSQQLNDLEKAQATLDADKQAYLEREQSQTQVRAFQYTHTAAHDEVVE